MPAASGSSPDHSTSAGDSLWTRTVVCSLNEAVIRDYWLELAGGRVLLLAVRLASRSSSSAVVEAWQNLWSPPKKLETENKYTINILPAVEDRQSPRSMWCVVTGGGGRWDVPGNHFQGIRFSRRCLPSKLITSLVLLLFWSSEEEVIVAKNR